MLTHLLAFGILAGPPAGTGTGPVIATDDRTAVLAIVQTSNALASSIPQGAPIWRQQYDPGDHAPYAFDFSALLGEDEKIAEIEAIKLSAAAALLGFSVDTSQSYAPIIDVFDGKRVQLWFLVDQAAWESASFGAAGAQLPVTLRILTDSVPPKRFERTGVLVVRQL